DENGESLQEGSFNQKQSNLFIYGLFAYQELRIFAKDREVSKGLWDPEGDNFADKLITIPAPIAGAIDAIGNKVTEIIELKSLAVNLVNDPQKTFDDIWDAVVGITPQMIEDMVITELTNLSDNGVLGSYSRSRAITGFGLEILMGAAGVTLLKNLRAKIPDQIVEASGPILLPVKNWLTKLQKIRDKVGNKIFSAKVKALDEVLQSKFVNDFYEKINGFKDLFKDFPETVDMWKVLADLPQSVRAKALNLESALKLDALIFDNDLIKHNKAIHQIIEGIDQIGDQGIYVLNKIKDSSFEDVAGYKDLVGGIKKAGVGNVDGNVAYEVRQTFQKLDVDLDIPNNKKVLGDKVTTTQANGGPNPDTDYDIDYGVKLNVNDLFYKDAYQFKVKNAKQVRKLLAWDKLEFQIPNMPSENKILQIAIRENTGTLQDVLNSQNFSSRLAFAKQNIDNFKLIITDHLGEVLIEL
ncbi:MAG: hypothetical protein ACI94Y_004597, partial [Maribacter sp.]